MINLRNGDRYLLSLSSDIALKNGKAYAFILGYCYDYGSRVIVKSEPVNKNDPNDINIGKEFVVACQACGKVIKNEKIYAFE